MRLAFLHAFPLDQTMWVEQLEIAPGRCDAPNLYAFGKSLDSWAAGVLNSVGTGPVIAIGASMGGSCAIEMARQAPDRIAALVLVGAKAGHRPEPNARDEYIATLRANGINGMWPQIANWIGPTAPLRVVDAIESIASAQNTDDLITAVQVFHRRADQTEVVAQWTKPLLVISGGNDPVVTRQKAIALSRLAPNAKLHIMADCGHYMNMERPGEFNQVVAEFVQSVGAGIAG